MWASHDRGADVAAAHFEGHQRLIEMVKVGLWGSLTSYTGGATHVEVAAGNIREMLLALGQNYPGLKPHLDRGVAVSINGQIYRDAWFQKIPEGAEVFLLPKLAGG